MNWRDSDGAHDYDTDDDNAKVGAASEVVCNPAASYHHEVGKKNKHDMKRNSQK